MIDTPGERLELFIKSEFKTKRDFCKHIGLHENALSKYCGDGKRSIFGLEYQEKLSQLGLNTAWYLTGQGNMLYSDIQTGKPPETYVDIDKFVASTTALIDNGIKQLNEYQDETGIFLYSVKEHTVKVHFDWDIDMTKDRPMISSSVRVHVDFELDVI